MKISSSSSAIVSARVPLPPDAPGLAPPQRAGDQADQAEEHGELGGRDGDAIGPPAALEQVDGARDAADADRR